MRDVLVAAGGGPELMAGRYALPADVFHAEPRPTYGEPVIAATPEPPYTAVIFTSLHTDDVGGYAELSAAMSALAAQQPGWLGEESARTQGGVGITVSYWVDAAAARSWRAVAEHRGAQRLGVERFYAAYRVRVATVDRG